MARMKPNPEVIADRAQAEAALAEIAAIDRKIAAREAAMQEMIDHAKAEASQYCNPLMARRKELADAVAVYAKLNKQELFSKAKSVDLGFGIIGFRQSTRISQIRGITSAMTLEKIRQFNFADGIRQKEELNKEAALGWPDERLELVGLKRQILDTFFIEIKKEEVPNEAA